MAVLGPTSDCQPGRPHMSKKKQIRGKEKHNACVMPPTVVLPLKLWDFLSDKGENVILKWVKDDKISVKDRAKLNQRLDRLVQMDFDTAIKTSMLAGPINKSKHIYKLRVFGEVMLRPMLCKGPVNKEAEYTLLLGAVETGDELPPRAVDKAIANRDELIRNPEQRCAHVRIPSKS